MKTITKIQIAQLVKEGKIENLKKHLVFFNKKQLIDALHLMFNEKNTSYDVSFESVPYSRGGKYARHTGTLNSTQSWSIQEYGVSGFMVLTNSTSKSGNCPFVVIPTFGTVEAKEKLAKIQENEAKKAAEKSAKLKAEYEAKKQAEQKQKRNSKNSELKVIAMANGFSSVSKLKEAQKEIDTFNTARYNRAIANRLETYEADFGKFEGWKIQDRVKISRIELVFDCEFKKLY